MEGTVALSICVVEHSCLIPFDWQLTAGTLDVALYNITADPEERNDLSQVLPDVVKKMKERMDYYIHSSVPPLFKGTDPNALKIACKNGIWGPWM